MGRLRRVTVTVRMVTHRVIAALAGFGFLALAACSGTAGNQKPEFANKNEREVSIVHAGWFVPRPMAQAHCQQFGKSAFYTGSIRISDISDRKIYYFDCLYPRVE